MGGKTLTQGKPWQVIFSFMFPIFAGLLLQQLYNTVDTLVVGNFTGEAPLAAVGVCGVLTMAFLVLANGSSAGACVLIAQHFGAGEKVERHVRLEPGVYPCVDTFFERYMEREGQKFKCGCTINRLI